MTGTVGEVMTANPIWVRADSPVREAAQRMAEAGVGAVIVVHGDQVLGICTDRDITVRVIATNLGPDTPVQHACSAHQIAAIAATMSITAATDLMRRHAVRRLPVLRDKHLVGIVSLADLVDAQDSSTVIGDISAAPPNR